MATSDEFCRAQAIDEPLLGTAKPGIQRWILVEDGGPWRAKVPRDSELPADLIARLIELDALPKTRVQMIRRPGQGCGDRRRVFVVDALSRRVASLELELGAIASLDPDAALAHAIVSERLDDLWLVCTHGTRDRCCAKWGMAIWDGIHALAPERAWQVSHLGGHRFAPTFMVLPVGLTWGRFDAQTLPSLVESLARGELGALDRLRGRGVYPPAAQVAEVRLRQEHGWEADDALTLREVRTMGEGRFEVEFDTPADAQTVGVESVPGDPTSSNCGDEPSLRKSLQVVN